MSFDQALKEVDIQGSQAHAAMLAKQGLLTADEANSISQALNEIKNLTVELDPNIEDIHMWVEQKLIEKIGETGKKLHTGRSRNDQVALDLRLYTKSACDQISVLLTALIATLNPLQQKHQADPMPGYTHLQQAQPITLGLYFGAYSAMFTRDHSRLQDCLQRLDYSPLGAGALAGSQLPLDREYVAKQLGFSGVIENTLDAVSDRDFVIEFSSVASIMMIHLSRLSEDLIIWATQEFNFITLDDAYSTGSSLMPNKKNPDVLELIRGKSGRVFGNLIGILTVMKGLPLAYNKDLQEDKEGLFDTVKTLTACLTIITPFLKSLTFNVEVMKTSANSGYLNATHVLEALVIKGMPFRDAHHLVGQWVQAAMEQGCTLTQYLKEQDHGIFDLS